MLDPRKNKTERNKRLKVRAVQLENEWNQAIKDGLNSESVFRIFEMESVLKAEKLRVIREQVEALSLQYNFPTKNDVANIARLLIQIEEKIDHLEDVVQNGAFRIGHEEKRPKLKPKIILEDTVKHDAIVSMLPGLDAKVIRKKAGGNDE